MLLLRDLELADSELFLQFIRQRIEALKVDGVEQPNCVTVSIGIAQYRPREPSALTINRADEALYASKAAGRNRIMLESA